MRPLAATSAAGALAACIVSVAAAAPPPEAELQRTADALIATSDIPAVITLVEEDGVRTVVASGEGEVGVRRADPADRFWIGSVTKSFVATVVMQLVAEGRLQLDDRVDTLLPGRLRQGRRISLRHLLNHTSGIPDYMNLQIQPQAGRRARNSPGPLVTAAGRQPLEFAPGTQASYSNTNYLVLAEIVRRVERRPLAGSLRNRILRPLALDATTYTPGRRELRSGDLHGYDVSSLPPTDVSLVTLGGPWADGAIVSSAADLATFFGALLRGRVVPPRLLSEMLTIVPRSHGEGLGMYRLSSPCGRWFYGHTGGTPGYVTFAAGSRDGSHMVVVSWNGVSPAAIADMDRYLDELLCR